MKSNRLICRVGILLLFACMLSGLSSGQRVFQAGLLGGLSTSQISGDTYGGFNKAGPIFGGFIETTFSEKIAGAFQVYYVQKGSRKNPDPENGDLKLYALQLNYIEVPLLFYYKLGKFRYNMGPSIGTLLGYSEADENGDFPDSRDFNSIELGYQLGFQYEISEHIFGDFRYGGSIVPVRDHPSGQSFGANRGQYNSVVYFLLNYKF